jgi:hypothetical protein
MVSNVIEQAYEHAGFAAFEDCLAAYTGKTLRQMAHILGVKEQTLILYHSQWIDDAAKAGKVQPMRLKD